MSEMITSHFSVREFLATAHRAYVTEQRNGWDNDPTVRANAKLLCELLEKIRDETPGLGPLRLTSGYRCPGLNASVGGVPTSRHMFGLAADVQPVSMGERQAMGFIVGALRLGTLDEIDKVILEPAWLHIQLAEPGATPKRLALQTSDGRSYERWV